MDTPDVLRILLMDPRRGGLDDIVRCFSTGTELPAQLAICV